MVEHLAKAKRGARRDDLRGLGGQHPLRLVSPCPVKAVVSPLRRLSACQHNAGSSDQREPYLEEIVAYGRF
jgi:hypothetical protein